MCAFRVRQIIMISGSLKSYLAPTLRAFPADAELQSHKLLVRAGYIRNVGSGIYSLLPLGYRTARKIEEILRQEMNAVEGQEVYLPVTQPNELWRESGRWDEIGDEMVRFKDRAGRDMCLAMTHEETIVHLVRNDVKSYRQLPLLLYQLQTKFRDEPRPRGGLIRVREFTMKDAYSFHSSEKSLEETYQRLYKAYEKIFDRCGVKYVIVESDPGMMGGKVAHEYIAPADCGEDTIIRCTGCEYSANRQVARFKRDELSDTDLLEIEEIETPGKETIADVAEFLGIPESQTAKAVFFHSSIKGLVFCVLRGDYEINETQLLALLGGGELRPAQDDEITACGAVAGYASPIDVKNAFVVADTSLECGRNFVSGANKPGYHLKNVNMGRDFKPDAVAEIAAAAEGHICTECGEALYEMRGIEIGNIFQLGTRYSGSMGGLYQDQSGTEQPYIMGCYGIGVGRLFASVIEQSHDDYGIIWPRSISPFDGVLIVAKDDLQEELAKVKKIVENSTLDFLIDDRDLRAGVKFKDADLMGFPVRITFGKKAAEGKIEVKDRRTGESQDVLIDELEKFLEQVD
ncbi:MAG: proline--tRNA ligase [Candidatus Lindowbacteria bacterium]|nr:proline--tRNA ligase [Candidatus Lindowbacteria bacterium]